MEPREFGLSRYQRSKGVLAGAACLAAALLLGGGGLRLAFSVPGSYAGVFWGLAAGYLLVSGAGAALLWTQARRPFARVGPEGLRLYDALSSWSARWDEVYAAETPDRCRLVLRLAGRRSRTVSLLSMEREDRAAFVTQVREWSRRAG